MANFNTIIYGNRKSANVIKFYIILLEEKLYYATIF